jgi:hypothetical protein
MHALIKPRSESYVWATWNCPLTPDDCVDRVKSEMIYASVTDAFSYQVRLIRNRQAATAQ